MRNYDYTLCFVNKLNDKIKHELSYIIKYKETLRIYACSLPQPLIKQIIYSDCFLMPYSGREKIKQDLLKLLTPSDKTLYYYVC